MDRQAFFSQGTLPCTYACRQALITGASITRVPLSQGYSPRPGCWPLIHEAYQYQQRVLIYAPIHSTAPSYWKYAPVFLALMRKQPGTGRDYGWLAPGTMAELTRRARLGRVDKTTS